MGAAIDFFAQVLTKDEGGRYTPFTSGYKPQLFLRTADVAVELNFGQADKMASSYFGRHLPSVKSV